MTLERVGTGQGPALSRLEHILSLTTDQRVFAAGGIRNKDDLLALEQLSLSGVLVASALHNLSFDKTMLEKYSSRHDIARD